MTSVSSLFLAMERRYDMRELRALPSAALKAGGTPSMLEANWKYFSLQIVTRDCCLSGEILGDFLRVIKFLKSSGVCPATICLNSCPASSFERFWIGIELSIIIFMCIIY